MSLLKDLFGRGKPPEPPSWITYRSRAGFYSVEHPANWRVTVKDNIVNICTPDDTGAVTVSAFHGTAPLPDFPRTWLADTFEHEEPMSEPEVISRNGWTGLRQGFASAAPDVRVWIGIVATRPPVFVLITANDTPSQFRERGADYTRILGSLRLAVPKGPQGG